MTNKKKKKDQQAKQNKKTQVNKIEQTKLIRKKTKKLSNQKVWNSQAKQQASKTTNKQNEQVKPSSKTTNK